MKRRLAAILAVVGLASIFPITPAHAAYSTPWNCETYNPGWPAGTITTCVYVEWGRQADGQGVRLDGFHVWTSNGCSEFDPSYEDPGGAYNPVNPKWMGPNGVLNYAYDFGQEPCTFDKDLSNAGFEDGPMWFEFRARARIDDVPDKIIWMTWRLGEAGGYDLEASYVTDV